MSESRRIDGSDLTVVVSVAIDSEQRLDNLVLLLRYLFDACDGVAVIVVEQSAAPRLESICASFPGTDHVTLRDRSPHWKTRNLNHGAHLSDRQLVLFADCDVAPTIAALDNAMQRLRDGASFVQVFNGILVNVDREILRCRPSWRAILEDVPHFNRWHQSDRGDRNLQWFSPLYGNENYLATGGCTAVRRRSHTLVGGWNENIVSYGFEDQEYVERILRLGWSFERTAGQNAYHLDHPRGEDSLYNELYRFNEAEFERIRQFSAAELESYVANGFRRFSFKSRTRYERRDTDIETTITVAKDNRTDLGNRTVVVAVDRDTASSSDTGFEDILDLLENTYRNYRIVLVESGGRRYKYLRNKLNIEYRNDGTTNRVAPDPSVVKLVRNAAENREAIIARLVGETKERIVSRPADATTATLLLNGIDSKPEGCRADLSKHAIYMCFDDNFFDFARACINSLTQNFPNHPPIFADYAGADLAVTTYLDDMGVETLGDTPAPGFARAIGPGPVGNPIVFRRFRLWGAQFDRVDTLLHLDADTLVLGDLTETFASDAFRIVPNHESTEFVRVFDPIYSMDPELNARLEADAIPYPSEPDTLANAGVFWLPRSLRTAAERDCLAYLADRYAPYLAYADQSLISLWCHYRKLPFFDDVRFNYQTPFITDPAIDTPLSSARILHFSSRRKPGTDEFRAWDRAGSCVGLLEEAFDYYRRLY